MGGRGASSGISTKGKKYGTEYEKVLNVSNIKFIKKRGGGSIKAPMETMTRGRIYVTLSKKGELAYITYYDKMLKRNKQIDLRHGHDGMKPHVHKGYEHDENGTRSLTEKEKNIVDKVRKAWNNRGA